MVPNSNLEGQGQGNSNLPLYKTFRSLSIEGGQGAGSQSTSGEGGNLGAYAGRPYLHDMPRRRRASPTTEDSRSKRAKTTSSRKRGENDSAFSSKKCIAWFHEYSAPDEDVIGPEGMEKFCEDIGVEPENIVMLSLAWKLNAKQMGFFTLAEWLKGMTEIQSDSNTRLQSKLDFLRSLLNDPALFKSIYRYAFDFAREKDQRSMDLETAKAMLGLLLGKNWPLFGYFHQFLEQAKYKVINKDQWCNVLEFSRHINADLSNYDEDGAWPVMLDEFVEWYREQQGTPVKPEMETGAEYSMNVC